MSYVAWIGLEQQQNIKFLREVLDKWTGRKTDTGETICPRSFVAGGGGGKDKNKIATSSFSLSPQCFVEYLLVENI